MRMIENGTSSTAHPIRRPILRLRSWEEGEKLCGNSGSSMASVVYWTWSFRGNGRGDGGGVNMHRQFKVKRV